MVNFSLTDFNDFFGALAALNLAFAGSETFRSVIDDGILKIKTVVKPIEIKLSELDKENTLIEDLGAFVSETLRIKRDKLDRYTEEKISILKKEVQVAAQFPVGLKSIFLMTGLYCLTMLVIGGYKEYLGENFFKNSMTILYLCPVFNLLLFIRNGFSRYQKINISSYFTIISFIIILLISIFINRFTTNVIIFDFKTVENYTALSILSAVSPYLLYFLKAMFHKILFYFKYQLLFFKIKKEYKKLYAYFKDISDDLLSHLARTTSHDFVNSDSTSK